MENGNGNGRMANAVSMESLDNCSTTSSADHSSQVRTLFVSGLPIDTRARELYLLFRSCTGYEASQLKVTNKSGKAMTPVGFVTFATRGDADEARRQLQGIRFDPDSAQTLRLELARSNTKVTKPKTQVSPPVISPSATNAQGAALSMLPPPLPPAALAVNPQAFAAATGNAYFPNVSNAHQNVTAAAAALAVAAQAAAAHQAANDNASLAASMLAMNNGVASAGLSVEQLSMLSAITESQQLQHHQQQQQQTLQLIAASQAAASYPFYTPISTVSLGNPAIGQYSAAQQAALAAAMAQFQQHQQPQVGNSLAVMSGATGAMLSLPSAQLSQQPTSAVSGLVALPQAPCSTLFVANLGVNVNEEEVREVFKRFPGFSRLRMHTKGGAPVAFVEFHDVRQAAVALSSLHGYQLSTCERGTGIRIEFARSKMGDVSHNNSSANASSTGNNTNGNAHSHTAANGQNASGNNAINVL